MDDTSEIEDLNANIEVISEKTSKIQHKLIFNKGNKRKKMYCMKETGNCDLETGDLAPMSSGNDAEECRLTPGCNDTFSPIASSVMSPVLDTNAFTEISPVELSQHHAMLPAKFEINNEKIFSNNALKKASSQKRQDVANNNNNTAAVSLTKSGGKRRTVVGDQPKDGRRLAENYTKSTEIGGKLAENGGKLAENGAKQSEIGGKGTVVTSFDVTDKDDNISMASDNSLIFIDSSKFTFFTIPTKNENSNKETSGGESSDKLSAVVSTLDRDLQLLYCP